MSAILQCLSNIIPFAEYFYNSQYRKIIDNGINDVKISKELAEVITDLWSCKYKVISPKILKNVLGQNILKEFGGQGQQDCHELLIFMLDQIHSDLKEVTEVSNTTKNVNLTKAEKDWLTYTKGQKSIVSRLFFGQLSSAISCKICHEKNSTYDVFNVLSLLLPSADFKKCNIYVSL